MSLIYGVFMQTFVDKSEMEIKFDYKNDDEILHSIYNNLLLGWKGNFRSSQS